MTIKKGEVLIGYVGIDSGQMLCCDPCYIDSEWKKEDLNITETAIHPDGKKETIQRCSPRWWELLDDINNGKIKIETKVQKTHNFSYAACAEKTLKDPNYGQLNYKMGHAGVGVVFSSGIGDGLYPVYAKIANLGEWGDRIMEVRIDMTEHPCLENKRSVKKNGNERHNDP